MEAASPWGEIGGINHNGPRGGTGIVSNGFLRKAQTLFPSLSSVYENRALQDDQVNGMTLF
jgi:hypothetical protein